MLGACAGLRQEGELDCIGRDQLSASKVAKLYLDTESSLCRRTLSAAGAHHAWFGNDTQVRWHMLAHAQMGGRQLEAAKALLATPVEAQRDSRRCSGPVA